MIVRAFEDLAMEMVLYIKSKIVSCYGKSYNHCQK